VGRGKSLSDLDIIKEKEVNRGERTAQGSPRSACGGDHEIIIRSSIRREGGVWAAWKFTDENIS